jgi:hypothetical protein
VAEILTTSNSHAAATPNSFSEAKVTRRFTEIEVRQIFDKAVKNGPHESPVATDGLTLEDIKAIGAEVGIDGVSLERAARSVEAQIPQRKSIPVGGAISIHSERRVDGDLDALSTNEILSTIRRGMGRHGDLSEVGDILEWRSKGEMADWAISLSSAHGPTTVAGSGDLRNAALVTFLPAGFLAVFSSIIGFTQAADSGNAIGMVLTLLVLPVLFLILRAIFGRISRAQSAKLERVLDDLCKLIAEADDRDSPDEISEPVN